MERHQRRRLSCGWLWHIQARTNQIKIKSEIWFEANPHTFVNQCPPHLSWCAWNISRVSWSSFSPQFNLIWTVPREYNLLQLLHNKTRSYWLEGYSATAARRAEFALSEINSLNSLCICCGGWILSYNSFQVARPTLTARLRCRYAGKALSTKHFVYFMTCASTNRKKSLSYVG